MSHLLASAIADSPSWSLATTISFSELLHFKVNGIYFKLDWWETVLLVDTSFRQSIHLLKHFFRLQLSAALGAANECPQQFCAPGIKMCKKIICYVHCKHLLATLHCCCSSAAVIAKVLVQRVRKVTVVSGLSRHGCDAVHLVHTPPLLRLPRPILRHC